MYPYSNSVCSSNLIAPPFTQSTSKLFTLSSAVSLPCGAADCKHKHHIPWSHDLADGLWVHLGPNHQLPPAGNQNSNFEKKNDNQMQFSHNWKRRKNTQNADSVLCIFIMNWLYFISAITLLKRCVFDFFLDFGRFEQLCQPVEV